EAQIAELEQNITRDEDELVKDIAKGGRNTAIAVQRAIDIDHRTSERHRRELQEQRAVSTMNDLTAEGAEARYQRLVGMISKVLLPKSSPAPVKAGGGTSLYSAAPYLTIMMGPIAVWIAAWAAAMTTDQGRRRWSDQILFSGFF